MYKSARGKILWPPNISLMSIPALGGHSLWVIENSGRPVVFELKTLFGHKVLLFLSKF